MARQKWNSQNCNKWFSVMGRTLPNCTCLPDINIIINYFWGGDGRDVFTWDDILWGSIWFKILPCFCSVLERTWSRLKEVSNLTKLKLGFWVLSTIVPCSVMWGWLVRTWKIPQKVYLLSNTSPEKERSLKTMTQKYDTMERSSQKHGKPSTGKGAYFR